MGDGALVEALCYQAEHAVAHTAFYRERFRAAGLRIEEIASIADIARLPFVKKEDLIDDQAARPPFGTQLAVPPRWLRRVHVSAGNMYFGFTQADLDTFQVSNGAMYATAGIRPGDVVDVSSSFHWVIAGSGIEATVRALGATAIPGGPGMSDFRIRVMRDMGTTVLQAFTPYAESLGEEVRAAGIDPARDLRLRLLLVGGELRDEEATQRLEALWGGGVRVREMYGTTEVGTVAMSCYEVGQGMHVRGDCLVETVDPDSGEPAPDGDGGELVVTELARQAQPMLRFRTGDITDRVITEPCPCGRTTPRLGRIVGRRSGLLRVKGVFVQPTLVAAVLERFEGLGRHQIIVDRPRTRDRMRVVIEVARHGSLPKLADDIAERLRSSIGIGCEVELVGIGALGDAPPTADLRATG